MKKISSTPIGLLDTRYLKIDQSTPQTLTASPVLNWMTNGSVPFIGTGGYLAQDNSHLFFNSTTYDLFAYTLSTSQLTVTGWTAGWVLYAGAGGVMTGENEFNYVTATNTLNVANIVSTGEINGVTLSTANLSFNTNVITSDTGLVHFNDDNIYTMGTIEGLTLIQNGTSTDNLYVNITGDNLEGNLTCNAGVLIDGYDVSVEFASIDTGIDGGTF